MRTVIVVGAGAFGASAALELRRRGYDVRLFDPGPVPHPRAASTDLNKVIRVDYGPDEFYIALGEASVEVWERWNASWPKPPFRRDGLVILSRPPMADGSYERRTFDLLERRGHAPERLDADALLARYPLLRPDAFSEGYANARAGWADSAAVTDEVVRQCRSRGVELRFGEPMSRLLQDGEGRVRGIATANGQQHRADRVVVAAGAWTPKLLPWLQEVMWPITQSVIHFRPDDPTRFRAPDFPTWVADGADGGWFGFPANDDGLVKVGSHGPGARLDPDDSRDVPGGEIDRCLAYLDGVLPELARMPIVASHRCLYCQTFDSYFWIARDPDREGLVVATGGSGRGFKFITHVGTWVADVIEGRESAVTHRFGWRAPVRIRPAST